MPKKIVETRDVPGLAKGMDYVRLGDSDLVVSNICMGTMTYGSQNTEAEGVALLSKAFRDYGVNFVDTAEVYPVPTLPDTQGDTDRIVAKFLKTQQRKDVVLATKVSGRSDRVNWLPRAEPDTLCNLSKEQIIYSVDESLKRLETDYIDLLQLHWPDRYVPIFGSPDFSPTAYEEAPTPVPFQEQLEALQELITAGKVRHVGVSSETPYGICSLAQLVNQFPERYPKIITTQNAYSLVCRKDYEGGLSEVCYHHNVGLLAFSPLGGGALTGKYRNQELPPGSRFANFPDFMRRYLDKIREPVDAYCQIAEKHGLSPAQLALSYCYHNELVSSTIIGATSLDQLEENIMAHDVRLSDEIIAEIQLVYGKYTDPTKQY
jgi:aryl-alcohol dehydrogenase-like predicted oxidoreductase